MVNPCKELIFGKSSPEGKEGPSMSASKERECATESEWALVGAITFLDLRHDFEQRAEEAAWPPDVLRLYLGYVSRRGATVGQKQLAVTLVGRPGTARGNARSFIRDYAEAVDAYSRALIVNPRSAVAWCNKAEALIYYGHSRSALNEATELDRRYARTWTLKADIYESIGKHQEAQKAANAPAHGD